MTRKYCAVVVVNHHALTLIDDDGGWMFGFTLGGDSGNKASETVGNLSVPLALSTIGVSEIRHHQSKFGDQVLDGVGRRWQFNTVSFVFDVDHPRVGELIRVLTDKGLRPSFFPVVRTEDGTANIVAHRQFWKNGVIRPKYQFINVRGSPGMGEASTDMDYPLDEAVLGPGPVSDSLGTWYRLSREGGVLTPGDFDVAYGGSGFDYKKITELLKYTAVDTVAGPVVGAWRGEASDFWWSGPDHDTYRASTFYTDGGDRGEGLRYYAVLVDTHYSNEEVVFKGAPDGEFRLGPNSTDSRILDRGRKTTIGEFKYSWYIVEASSFSDETTLHENALRMNVSIVPFYREWRGAHIGRAMAVEPGALRFPPSWLDPVSHVRGASNPTGAVPIQVMSDETLAAEFNPAGPWGESGPTYGFYLGVRNGALLKWDHGKRFGDYPQFKLGDRFDALPETFNVFVGTSRSEFFDNQPWKKIPDRKSVV